MSLETLPASYTETRKALHQIAFFAVSPARHKTMGRMGLTATPGGFGTPEYEGQVARVEGAMLIHEKDGNIASQQISTIRAASELFGFDYEIEWFPDFHDPLAAADPEVDLMVDSSAGVAIGEWFRFGIDALDELRGHGQDDDDVSEVQLWPEHFDPATELGVHEKGQRASFGASPGDGANPELYLYVASWSDIDHSNPFWNGKGFNGASLGYAELLSSDDPSGRALEFLIDGYRVLHAS